MDDFIARMTARSKDLELITEHNREVHALVNLLKELGAPLPQDLKTNPELGFSWFIHTYRLFPVLLKMSFEPPEDLEDIFTNLPGTKIWKQLLELEHEHNGRTVGLVLRVAGHRTLKGYYVLHTRQLECSPDTARLVFQPKTSDSSVNLVSLPAFAKSVLWSGWQP